MAAELRHLRYLLAVAEHGSFTRAAEELRVSQPTLSQQVRQLERSVGAPLLDRSGRTVRLTDAGSAYAVHARRALRDLAAAERAVADVHDLSRGHLRVAATPTFTAYLVAPLVAELHRRHPGITVDVREGTQDVIESGLLADRFDLGIAFAGRHLPQVAASALFTETLGLVVGAGHPRAPVRQPLPARSLGGIELALLSGDFATRQHIDDYFTAHRVSPRVAVEANSVQAITEIVQQAPIATVLPDGITHDHPRLRPLPLDPPLPARTAVLLRRENAYQPAAARAFGEIAGAVVRARGWSVE